jgi:7-cyano-7-deazaguanine synthase
VDVKTLLFSGGIDSTVAAYMRPHAHLLIVDYGQEASEINAAQDLAREMDRTLHEVMVGWAGGTLQGNCLTDARAPLADFIVPNRNLWLLALAATWTKSRGGDGLIFAATQTDRELFRDCRPEWVPLVERLIDMPIETPLIHKTKREVIEIGKTLGVPLHLAWSCYRATDSGGPCGQCLSCAESRRGAIGHYTDVELAWGEGC